MSHFKIYDDYDDEKAEKHFRSLYGYVKAIGLSHDDALIKEARADAFIEGLKYQETDFNSHKNLVHLALLEISSYATRKERASDLKKYLIIDLEMVESKVRETLKAVNWK